MNVHIFTGFPPDDSGTGRLVATLVEQARLAKGAAFTFHHGAPHRPGSLDHALRDEDAMNADVAVLVHPQALGFSWCMEFMNRRKQPTWFYVMDAGFFCARSYNHIQGEDAACLRCLGGAFENITRHECPSFPFAQDDNEAFLRFVHARAARGQVKFLVQNDTFGGLVTRHFGPDTTVRTIGLWADFDVVARHDDPGLQKNDAFDVVFHANPAPAKGVDWLLEVAKQCPEHSFLFPFRVAQDQQPGEVRSMDNLHFGEVSWETGLAALVAGAKLTLCPSLWSAPVEGALVKSIAFAPLTGVVEEPTAFSAEIPDDVLLKLPKDVEAAAQAIRTALAQGRTLSPARKKQWINSFILDNKFVMRRMAEALSG